LGGLMEPPGGRLDAVAHRLVANLHRVCPGALVRRGELQRP
jgi:hypothetical protein